MLWLGGTVRAETLMLDTFDTATNPTDVNNELGSPRQSGTLMPAGGFGYVAKGHYNLGGGNAAWTCTDNQLLATRTGSDADYLYQTDNKSALAGAKYDVSATIVFPTAAAEWTVLGLNNDTSTGIGSAWLPTTGITLFVDPSEDVANPTHGSWELVLNGVSAASGTMGMKISYAVKLAVDETGASTVVDLYLDGGLVGSGAFTWNDSNRYLGVGTMMRSASSTTGFDNLSVSMAIPEPSSIAILVSALTGMLAYAWRKQK